MGLYTLKKRENVEIRQFIQFAARQGFDVFISLYMCSFRHGISFEGPHEVLLEILSPG